MNFILLSGGSGTRLWPLSNNIRSKQFLEIFKKSDGTYESMVQRMYRMIKDVEANATITIATAENQVGIIRSQLGDSVSISLEPCRRDTFPAIALATAYLHDNLHVERDEAVVVCPVDPYVNEDYFQALLKLNDMALNGTSNLTLMGINPTYPSAKYGYIIPATTEDESVVNSFREKPTEAEAEELINRGALWNGGVFAYKLSYVLDRSKELLGTDLYKDLFDNYENLAKISFDYAVVEKEKNISVLRFRGEWKDLGTWNTLTEAMSDEVSGNAVAAECKNTHVINELQLPLIALGVKDLAIAATPDGILVSDKHMSSYLKNYVVDQRPMTEKRQWGGYEVLDYRRFDEDSVDGADNHSLTKHLFVKAGKKISYQRHNHRTETWVIVKGDGEVVLDGRKRAVHRGDTIVIPLGVKHAIRALTDLHIIEVQVGNELTEEDIERFEWNWTAREHYDRWIHAGLMTEELKCMTDVDVEEAFGSELHFGTGGIRAIMGAGTSRLNKYTVSRITEGVANYLRKHFEKPSVVIAYDTRHHSMEFALTGLSVFEKNGVRALMFAEPVPTPLLSYTVWKLNCSAGIVITASHNSKEYNGYKVYDQNGCQITDNVAKEIQVEIDGVDLYAAGEEDFVERKTKEHVSIDIYDDYFDSVKAASFVTGGDKDLRILYTPLNGTGLKFVKKALKDSGFKNVYVIPEQEMPNGDFPTCPYPNPELPAVMEYCVPYAKEKEVDIIIATDPDSDRIGVMCLNDGEYKRLNPNEVGVLLLDYICQKRTIAGKVDENTGIVDGVYNAVFMKTIVTTSMAERIAEKYGLRTINTLTGFKYIGEQMEKLSTCEGFVFGMEESCGYLSNPQIRDKDGVNAALLLCMMAQEYKGKGLTLVGRIQELYRQYGYYRNSQTSYTFEGSEGICKMKSILDRMHMPKGDGLNTVSEIDYSEGYKGLPPTNMREYRLSDGSRFVIRPSGTEPKLKAYIEAVGGDYVTAQDKAEVISRYVDELVRGDG